MWMSELFYSIQGEGGLLGVPSVFLRTSGCNLRCSWCDTPYTSWRPEGRQWDVQDLIAWARQHPAQHVVLTGGEPMLQEDAVPLTRALRDAGYHITIETAGTVYRPVSCDLMSVSPKLGNSTPDGPWAVQHDRLRVQEDVLRRIMAEFSYQLKFVVATRGDLGEIRRIVNAVSAPPGQVVLMPEGTEVALLRERSIWLVEVCKETGFRFSPRLHVDLWGAKRGV